MPILDHGPNLGWLVMPLAAGNLAQLCTGVGLPSFRS
jgi:hypothetical protein